MKGQVENSKCMNERAWKWNDCLRKKVRENFEGWSDILEEQQSYI